MAGYQTPITIKKAIDKIRNKEFVLPSIQREFVWDTSQIEMLFDSLMRDYPISTFLFWKVDKKRVNDFQFYEFLSDYHERDKRHNDKANLDGSESVIALLDGQQRMTSMYVALNGSYTKKLPYYKATSTKAYPVKTLHLDLLNPSDDAEMEYNFRFLSEKETKNDNHHFWFPCSQILDFEGQMAIMTYLMQNGLMDSSKYTAPETEFALKTLGEFYNVIHQKATLSYYQEEDSELDKVLQIFIRINSGGTKLSYSDLLLSIATAQWQQEDAREVIHELVDELNDIGDGFGFNKDLVLKTCLVLADFSDVKFKVDNFNQENMRKIESQWLQISNALKDTVKLVSKLGYSRDNLLSTNAIIPIAYFIFKNSCGDKLLHSSSHAQNRANIKEWLARVLLKGVFGNSPDSIYPAMRELINGNLNVFPLEQTITFFKGKRKSISFTEDDIDSLLDLQYGKPQTYCVLTLLYPSLNYDFKYHQDHIFPKAQFHKSKMRNNGYDEQIIEQFHTVKDSLPNIQLLEATSNIEKNDKPFSTWLEERYPFEHDKRSYQLQHYIDTEASLDFSEFLVFVEKRRASLKHALIDILNVKNIRKGDA
ncbi:hypothetical protein BCT61_05410 [Vibrio breoganii]|uniref:DUF262 domain-containing protein n=1 Tax=Vibrio breoganii TaxID=553239 RepID=UPI000C839DDB|nr:DUF262 domain-containing protein [Vibrio breoganii]PMK62553.1 hypothetical protein BCT98_04645 [Vibrio breoganii]PMM12461.1 hypothetical protein BCT61_05410 [Vibrio breoganii]